MKKLLSFFSLFTLVISFNNSVIAQDIRATRTEYRVEPYDLSGTNTICPSGVTYTVSNPSNILITWYAYGNLTPSSGSGNSFAVYATGDGNGYISVSLFFPNSGICTGWQPVADKIVTTVSSSTASADFSVLGNSTSNFLR